MPQRHAIYSTELGTKPARAIRERSAHHVTYAHPALLRCTQSRHGHGRLDPYKTRGSAYQSRAVRSAAQLCTMDDMFPTNVIPTGITGQDVYILLITWRHTSRVAGARKGGGCGSVAVSPAALLLARGQPSYFNQPYLIPLLPVLLPCTQPCQSHQVELLPSTAPSSFPVKLSCNASNQSRHRW